MSITGNIPPKLEEVLAHSGLKDMPDVAGLVSDHDGRYYTEAEVNALIAAITHAGLPDMGPANPDHDGRYYTEAEVLALIAAITHAGLPDMGPANPDHDGRYYTEAEHDAATATPHVSAAEKASWDSKAPGAHASQHQDSGSDEISVAGLSGLLADGQTPLAHKASHQDGGSDEISLAGLSGLNLDGLDDVNAPSPSDDDILYYALAAAEWKNKARGKTFFPLTGTNRIWRMLGVSSTPRTATISSVAADVITLTANHAYRFFDTLMSGVVYAKIANTSKSPSEYAWVKDRPAANQLQVTDPADISGWLNGETISTAYDGATSPKMEVDISPILGGDKSLIAVQIAVRDSGGGNLWSGCYDDPGQPTDMYQYTQVANVYNAMYGITPLAAGNKIYFQDVASGVDTLSTFWLMQAYLV